MDSNLNRFLAAQENDYEQALAEVKSGRKRSHWMWYIFPQFAGLGRSETSKFYALKSLSEAQEYLEHSILGSRLCEITNALLEIENTNATQVFGNPDDLKLKSCMTLFSVVDESDDNIFKKVLEKYFEGHFDKKTLKLIL